MEKSVMVSTGVQVSYVERGPADGLPVVFLHGVTDSWRSFERLLPLMPEDVRAFAPSARGHGDSSRPAAGYGISDMSEDLRAFMDAVGLTSAVIVGHSMGTLVAQRFAVDHPDRVSGLGLLGAFATLHRDPGLSGFYRTAVLPLADPLTSDFVQDWQRSTLARPMDPEHFDVVVAETLKVPSRVWREAFEGLLETPGVSDQLSSLSVPALVMWGDRDTYALREQQDRLLRALPQARFVVVEGGGHAGHWEDPSLVATALAPVLASAARLQ